MAAETLPERWGTGYSQGRLAVARLAARRHWHPGDDLDQLTEEYYQALELSGADKSAHDLIARAPKMTAGQLGRLRRLVRQPTPRAEGPGGGADAA